MVARLLTITFALGALGLGGCTSLACGEGTSRVGDECVAATRCGTGTTLLEGVCVPDADLSCGPGTRMEAGLCLPSMSGVCGAGTIERNGECVAEPAEWVLLPFEGGVEVRFGQSNRGLFSHDDASLYAVDFPVPEGTPVVAARGGVVVEARGDSTTGCGEVRCADQANFVVVDHGDGTLGRYWHLRPGGVAVTPGQSVCAGQLLGQSGNTGFSTAPHLHFAVSDLFRVTLPVRFEELRTISDGEPLQGLRVPSQNAAPGTCSTTVAPSECPADLFGFIGVELEAGVPCTRASRDTDYVVRGRSRLASGWVQVGTFDADDDRWRYRCVATAMDGSFQTVLRWDQATFPSGYTYLMLAAAEPDGSVARGCSALMSWAGSPRIALTAP